MENFIGFIKRIRLINQGESSAPPGSEAVTNNGETVTNNGEVVTTGAN